MIWFDYLTKQISRIRFRSTDPPNVELAKAKNKKKAGEGGVGRKFSSHKAKYVITDVISHLGTRASWGIEWNIGSWFPEWLEDRSTPLTHPTCPARLHTTVTIVA